MSGEVDMSEGPGTEVGTVERPAAAGVSGMTEATRPIVAMGKGAEKRPRTAVNREAHHEQLELQAGSR